MLLSPCPSLSLSLFCLHHYLDNSSKGALSLKCFCDHGVFLSLSLSLSLSVAKYQLTFFFGFIYLFIGFLLQFMCLGNSEACMVGSPLHPKILCWVLLSRNSKEEWEKHFLFGLLYKYLPPLFAFTSIPQASSDSSICISWCCSAWRSSEAHRLL